jgi:hypothetical protein
MSETKDDDASTPKTGTDPLYAEFERAVELITSGETTDFTSLVEPAEDLVGLLPETDPDRAFPLYMLSLAHLDRFDSAETGGSAADLERAITLLRQLRKLLPPDDPQGPSVALWLGLALSHRVMRAANLQAPDLAEAIGALTTGVNAEDIEVDSLLTARYRLGVLLAIRFLMAAGDLEDRTKAIEELTAVVEDLPASRPEADAVRLMLAQLELGAESPPHLRNGPLGITKDTVDLIRANEVRGTNAEAGIKALLHLDAISEATAGHGPMSGIVAMMRIRAQLEQNTDPQALSPDDLRTAVTGLDETLRHETPGSLEALAMNTLRAGLEAQRVQLTGGTEDAGPAVDQVLDVLSALGDHPMQSLARDLLGAMTSMPTPPSGSIDKLTAEVDRLERVLRELDDHPARTQALARFTMTALRRAIVERSGASLDRIHELLQSHKNRRTAVGDSNAVVTLLLSFAVAVQGMLGGDAGLLGVAMERIKEASEQLPPDHELQTLLGPQLAVLLIQRYVITHSLEDVDAVLHFAEMMPTIPAGSLVKDSIAEFTGWMPRMLKLSTALARPDELTPQRLDDLIAELDEVLELIPEHERRLCGLDRMRHVLSMFRSAQDEDSSDFPWAGRRRVDFRVAGGDFVRQDAPADVEETFLDWDSEDALILIGSGFADHDVRRINRGIQILTVQCAQPSDLLHERVVKLGALAHGFRLRHVLLRRPRDLDNAIVRFEQARQLALGEPGLVDTAPVLNQLGECYHTRGDKNRHDPARAVAAGLDGLAARMREVLTQTGASRALDTAHRADGEAAEVARWCVAAGDHGAAVRALELGRAMVLHSATVEADAPALLRDNGFADIAERWEKQSDEESSWDAQDEPRHPLDLSDARVPTTLRRDVLLAIEGTETEQRLLSAPLITDIAASLRQAGASALVYLVPSEDDTAGFALIVLAEGEVMELQLPGLDIGQEGEIEAFERAQRDLQQWDSETPEGRAADVRWTEAIAALSDWAWTIAMGPLLTKTLTAPPARPAKLVLVPVGKLGVVPWHAARRQVTGGIRYACQDVIISYTASARQIIDASRRGHRAWSDTPALVKVAAADDFDSDLYWVEEEIAGSTSTTTRIRPGWRRRRAAGGDQLSATAARGRRRLNAASELPRPAG